MKIYSSVPNILLTKLLPIFFYCLLIIPLSCFGFYVLKNTELAVAYGILFGGLSSILWLCTLLFKTLSNRHTEVLAITEEGFRYPYMLNPTIMIPWHAVRDIRMDEISTRCGNLSYVVIEIANEINLGKKKTFDGRNKYFAKSSRYQAIVISRRTMSNYDLQEMHDLLNLQWRKFYKLNLDSLPKQPFFEVYLDAIADMRRDELSGRPVQKDPFDVLVERMAPALSNQPISENSFTPSENKAKRYSIYYKTCFNVVIHSICFLLLMVIFWNIMALVTQTHSYLFLLISSFSLTIYAFLMLGGNKAVAKLAARYLKPMAIDFDKKGIYQVNKIKYSMLIPWEDVLALELEYKSRGRYRKPFIKLTLKGHGGIVRTTYIRNALKRTSVYELLEALKQYQSLNTMACPLS